MRKSWRPLVFLLLAVTALWFVFGPMRHAREGTTPSAGPTSWGTAAPTVEVTRNPDGSVTRRTSIPTVYAPAPSDRSTGGLFDAIDEAARRREAARRDSGSSSAEDSQRTSWLDRLRGRDADSSSRGAASPGTSSRSGSNSGSGNGSNSGSSSGSGSSRVTTQGALPADADKIALILDASGSMARRSSNGITSMEAAQDAMADALETVPEGTPVGLRVFGSRVDGHGRPTPQACRDTRVVQPIAPLNRRQMTTAIFSFDPLGETPIARSIAAAVTDLGTSGRRSILLVSDGEESCDPDPCRAVADARAAGVDVRIDTVGLRVGNRARDQLRCIATTTNGSYSEARTDADFGVTLRQALEKLGAERTTRSAAGSAAATSRSVTVQQDGSITASASSAQGGLGAREAAASGLLFLILLLAVVGASRRR